MHALKDLPFVVEEDTAAEKRERLLRRFVEADVALRTAVEKYADPITIVELAKSARELALRAYVDEVAP